MKNIITVDFDDTLATTEKGAWGGGALVPIERVIGYVKDQHSKGTEIHIISFRNWRNKKEIETFCKFHKIPVATIVCTNMEDKLPFIKKLQSRLHIDDNVQVCVSCIKAGIDVLLVDWDQENFHTSAKFMPKI